MRNEGMTRQATGPAEEGWCAKQGGDSPVLEQQAAAAAQGKSNAGNPWLLQKLSMLHKKYAVSAASQHVDFLEPTVGAASRPPVCRRQPRAPSAAINRAGLASEASQPSHFQMMGGCI